MCPEYCVKDVLGIYQICGGGGIRTHGPLQDTRFPSVRTRPLCDPSVKEENKECQRRLCIAEESKEARERIPIFPGSSYPAVIRFISKRCANLFRSENSILLFSKRKSRSCAESLFFRILFFNARVL